MAMVRFDLRKKRLLITRLEPGEESGHPVYVEKSVLQQLWDDYIKYLAIFVAGLLIGVTFG